jgi:hypothetical protein
LVLPGILSHLHSSWRYDSIQMTKRY